MVLREIPRLVIGADVLLDGIMLPSGDCAQLLNLVLDGHAVPVMDTRLSSLYSNVLEYKELNLSCNIVRDLLLKFSRLSEILTPSPLPSFCDDLLPEDVLYFQLAFSAGIVPVIKKDLHFYLDSNLAKNIPLFTAAGFVKEISVIKDLMAL